MKKLLIFASFMMAVVAIVSCSSTETYADKRDKEDDAIARFISDSNITVISEEEFEKQNYTTDVKENEYVLLSSSGVYMQIVRPGCGTKIESGEQDIILTRFTEYNILGDSLQAQNVSIDYASYPEHMCVINSSGTFTGIFENTTEHPSVMYYYYKSTAVPAGWLLPLRYVKVGRPKTADEEIAKVKLIVPASQGQAYASANVYPCYYELTFEEAR